MKVLYFARFRQAIGRGMAAALVCTFYGAFVANLFFLPLAGKLGMRSKHETLMREMVLQGVVGIVNFLSALMSSSGSL